MKHAILITADGETHQITGRFVMLTETNGFPITLSVVNYYRNGRDAGETICDTTAEALDAIAGWAAKGKR